MVGRFIQNSKGVYFFWTIFKPHSNLWSDSKMTFSNMVDKYFISDLFEIWSSFEFWSFILNLIEYLRPFKILNISNKSNSINEGR